MSNNDKFPEPQKSLRDILDFIADARDGWNWERAEIELPDFYEEDPEAVDSFNELTAKINGAECIRDFVFTKLREVTYKKGE